MLRNYFFIIAILSACRSSSEKDSRVTGSDTATKNIPVYGADLDLWTPVLPNYQKAQFKRVFADTLSALSPVLSGAKIITWHTEQEVAVSDSSLRSTFISYVDGNTKDRLDQSAVASGYGENVFYVSAAIAWAMKNGVVSRIDFSSGETLKLGKFAGSTSVKIKGIKNNSVCLTDETGIFIASIDDTKQGFIIEKLADVSSEIVGCGAFDSFQYLLRKDRLTLISKSKSPKGDRGSEVSLKLNGDIPEAAELSADVISGDVSFKSSGDKSYNTLAIAFYGPTFGLRIYVANAGKAIDAGAESAWPVIAKANCAACHSAEDPNVPSWVTKNEKSSWSADQNAKFKKMTDSIEGLSPHYSLQPVFTAQMKDLLKSLGDAVKVESTAPTGGLSKNDQIKNLASKYCVGCHAKYQSVDSIIQEKDNILRVLKSKQMPAAGSDQAENFSDSNRNQLIKLLEQN